MQEIKDQNLKLQAKLSNIQSTLELAIEEKKNIYKIHEKHIRKKIETENIEKNRMRDFSTEKISYQKKFLEPIFWRT